MARVVVVGAGVGGLAAAARLAAGGHEVTVVEASDAVGGKLGRVEHATEAGTFGFDVGPSLLVLPQVFRELFADTGAPLEDVLDLRPLDPITEYRFADGTVLALPREAGAVAAAHDAAFGPGTGAAWDRLLRRGQRMWQAVEQPVLRSALTPASAARRLGHVGDLAAIAPGRTVRGLGRHHLRDPRQRLMLDRYATFAGSDPRRTPAALAVIPYLEQAFGAWYVDGGLHRIAEAVADRARERGAGIRLGSRVEYISTAAKRVDGVVLTGGERLPADVVVANADAHAVHGSLLRPRPRTVPAADSLSGFVLLLGLRGTTPGLTHHTLLFGGSDYDREFDAVFGDSATPVADPAIYVCAPDDPACRPAGHEAWFVLVNAPRHGTGPGALDWDAAGVADDYADHVLDLLAKRGLDVRDRLLVRDVLTPADLERRTLAPGGAIYGSALHGMAATFRRPPNRTRTSGLFLVGGSTHPGGGLPMVTLSAAIVAGLVGPADRP